MLNKQQISELKIRNLGGQWVAGWYDDRFSPSSASGDMGFYSDTPEDAVKALLNYVLDNNSREAR
jgi:hypothetical protein